jgi:hypothetical protein
MRFDPARQPRRTDDNAEPKMQNRQPAAARLVLLFTFLLGLAGCTSGVSGPCNDSDPVGPCATSHSQTRGS